MAWMSIPSHFPSDQLLRKRYCRQGVRPHFAMRLRRILSDWNVRVLHAHNHTAMFYGALAIQLYGNSRSRLVARLRQQGRGMLCVGLNLCFTFRMGSILLVRG